MTHNLTLHVNGDTHEITANENETILDAALRNGIDVPYSCMSGTCNSCQATKLKGETEMEFSDALTDQEIKSGEILTCQARITEAPVEVRWPEF